MNGGIVAELNHDGIKTIQHVGIKTIESIDGSLELKRLGSFNFEFPQREPGESEGGKHEGDNDPVNIRRLPRLTGMMLNSSLSPLAACAMVCLRDPRKPALRPDVNTDMRSLANTRTQLALKHGKDRRSWLNRGDTPEGKLRERERRAVANVRPLNQSRRHVTHRITGSARGVDTDLMASVEI